MLVRMDHRLLGFHRRRKNATIQVITYEEGCKSAALPESAGKLLHDRWNEHRGLATAIGSPFRFGLRFVATLRIRLGAGSGLPSAGLFASRHV